MELDGRRILLAAGMGPVLGSESDAVDLVGEALGAGASLIAIPAQRLALDFYRLKTGLAGAMLQKITNYRLRLAVIGELPADASKASPCVTSSLNPTAAVRQCSWPTWPSLKRDWRRVNHILTFFVGNSFSSEPSNAWESDGALTNRASAMFPFRPLCGTRSRVGAEAVRPDELRRLPTLERV